MTDVVSHVITKANTAGSPTNKKRNSGKVSNTQLMPDTIEWPSLDALWQAIGDLASEMFLKSQPSLEEYEPTAKRFLARLCLIVRGFYQDQLMAVFRAILPAWYASADKVDKIRTSEIFESAHTWVETQLINKMQAYTKLWYATETRAKYYQEWHFAKYVLGLSLRW